MLGDMNGFICLFIGSSIFIIIVSGQGKLSKIFLMKAHVKRVQNTGNSHISEDMSRDSNTNFSDNPVFRTTCPYKEVITSLVFLNIYPVLFFYLVKLLITTLTRVLFSVTLFCRCLLFRVH